MGLVKIGLAAVVALALAVPDANAGGHGRGGGARASSSGARAGSSGVRHASSMHHPRGGRPVFVGGFVGGYVGGYYGYPYYYYPAYYPSPYYDEAVPLYPPEPADPYWYYCRAANAYYPYVQACPGGWERYLAGSPSG